MKRNKLDPAELSEQRRKSHNRKLIEESMKDLAQKSISLLDTLEDFPPELKSYFAVILGFKIMENAVFSVLNTENMVKMNEQLSQVLEGVQDLQKLLEYEGPFIY